jgi:hypothetical protein
MEYECLGTKSPGYGMAVSECSEMVTVEMTLESGTREVPRQLSYFDGCEIQRDSEVLKGLARQYLACCIPSRNRVYYLKKKEDKLYMKYKKVHWEMPGNLSPWLRHLSSP